jgi:trimeric autotransporter adhesin
MCYLKAQFNGEGIFMLMSFKNLICFSALTIPAMISADQNSEVPTQSPTSNWLAVSNCQDGAREATIFFQHREGNGIGYDRGYSSLNAFFDLLPKGKVHPFFDLRGHISNDGKWAANAGFGFRTLFSNPNTIFGANVFYDYRNAPHAAFHQMGAGLETFVGKWDFHLNGYFPFGETKKLYHDGFDKFKEHRAIFGKHYELAMIGGEASAGREFFTTKYVDMHGKLGGYYFSGHFGKHAAGGLFRLKSYVTPYFSVEGQVSYDSLFKDIYQGMVSFNIPFGQKPKANSLFSCNPRSMQPVDRFEMIVSKKHKKTSPAINPTTGQPLNFIFVNNTHPSSDGSFNSPFPTLLEAQNTSSAGDVIYVFAGDGTSKGMDQGFILKTQQQLIGSGAPASFTTRFGIRTIPAQTKILPKITAPSGNDVITANNTTSNVISGFNITMLNSNGINASNIQNMTILHNHFTDPLDLSTGVALNSGGGNILISDNAFGSISQPIFAAIGIGLNQSSNINVVNNTVVVKNGSGIGGFEIDPVGSNVSTTILCAFNKLTCFATEPGIIMDIGGSNVAISLSMHDNIITNAFGSSIVSLSNSFGDVSIKNNIMTNDQTNALTFSIVNSSLIAADVENNQFLNSCISISTNPGVQINQSNTSQTSLILANNTSTTHNNVKNGYVLLNTSSLPMVVESSNALLTGVASVNFGSSATPNSSTKFGPITTTGTIEYVPNITPISLP